MISSPRFSRHGRSLLLLAGAILLVAVTTQCRSVTDSVVRAQASSLNAGACISACANAANEAMRQESALHTANVKACKSPACKANESARHEAAVKAINDQRKRCQDGCHHQGGGKGGR